MTPDSDRDNTPGRQGRRNEFLRRIRRQTPADKAPFFQSLRIAMYGVLYVLTSERNAKIELVIALFAVVMGLVLRVSAVEWAILCLLIGLVLSLEVLNTAIEAVVDLTTGDYHILAKIAKDAAAGAVVLMAISSIGVGIAIFGPKLWRLIF